MDQLLVHGVLVTPQKRIPQPNGDILHAVKRSSPGFVGFGEAYFSMIHEGAIKGWRKHHRVTLNVVVPVGAVRFVIHDDREDSPTKGRFGEIVLGSTNHARLTVPPNLWVAFQGVGPGDSLVLNVADEEHDPVEAANRDLNALPYRW